MTDLLGKLQVKAGQTIAVVGGVPPGSDAWPLSTDPHAADAVLHYTEDAASLTSLVDELCATAGRGAACWVAYPKGGQLGTDLNRDSLAALVAAAGLQPVRQVSVDDVWSALRVKPA